jgi:hypothetical protein
VETGRSVVTDDGEKLGTRMIGTERLQRVGGETIATVVDLSAPCYQARDVCDSGNDHCKAVVRRSDLPGAFLLPRHVVDHQDDLIEAEGMQHIDRSDKMADVRRVECAPE